MRAKASLLRVQSLKHSGSNLNEPTEEREAVMQGAEGDDKDSLEHVLTMLRTARGDAKNMSDQQRRDAAARAAQQVSLLCARRFQVFMYVTVNRVA